MNTFHPSHPRSNSGGALIITLALTGSIGFALASYLFLVGQQNKSVMRSMAWNASMPIIEAGLEEALTHVHSSGMTNLYSNGWNLSSGVMAGNTILATGVYYTKDRYISNGEFCRVSISAVAPPTIYSQGYVKSPITQTYLPPRVVRVTTRRDGMFVKGMVAKGSINLNGQNVTSDSFDSSDPAYSTNGKYDPAKFKDGGDVASNSGITGIFNQGNADIYGHVATGPGGSVTVGPNGAAGSKAWIDGGNTGVQPGWFTDDMNVSFPDVQDPFTSGYSTPAGNPLRINSSGNYQLSDLNKSLIVRSNTFAVLKVTSQIQLTGNDAITIEPGATLHLYMAGVTTALGGKGVINQSGNATNFMYYGMPANTDLTFSGNGEFVGAIYAPNADFKMNGGGSGTQDFIGASVTSTVTMNGHFKFHYDENLGRVGPSTGYVITSWNEI